MPPACLAPDKGNFTENVLAAGAKPRRLRERGSARCSSISLPSTCSDFALAGRGRERLLRLLPAAPSEELRGAPGDFHETQDHRSIRSFLVPSAGQPRKDGFVRTHLVLEGENAGRPHSMERERRSLHAAAGFISLLRCRQEQIESDSSPNSQKNGNAQPAVGTWVAEATS